MGLIPAKSGHADSVYLLSRTLIMTTTNLLSPPRRMAGNAVPKLLAAALALVLIGAGVWYFVLRGPAGPAAPDQAAVPSTAATAPASTTAPAAAPAPQIDQLSVDQLFKEARTALNEQRLVAPPRNNALEFYLKILEKEPNNNGAQDALRELFTFAASAAEQNINGRNLEEAQRVLELLGKADPNNYTLTMLRSKLDAQRRVVEREQQQAQAQAEAAARRAAEPVAAPTVPAPAPATAEPAAPPPSRPAPSPATSTASTTAATTTPPPPAAPAPAPAGETRDAQLVRATQPQYPSAAARRRDEGWVEVEFAVMPDGSIANARVVDSQPPRLFDRAAIDAVQRWTFKPALRDGQPVQATLRRRIEFKMGGG